MNKPKLVKIIDPAELQALKDAESAVDLAAPKLIADFTGWYVDADELRAWRAARNADTVEPLR